MTDTPEPQGRPLNPERVEHYARVLREGAPAQPSTATVPGPLRSGQHRLAAITDDHAKKVGGHLLEPAGREKGANGQSLYRCQWCGTTGNYGLFNVIGQLDYCPDNVTSMNGYFWFNADDASVARTRASHQWHSHAKRAGYALVDYTEVDQPGICATFTWREQAYVVRYGRDAERGMNANDIRVELAEEKPEQTGA